jgi:hypothetical protein
MIRPLPKILACAAHRGWRTFRLGLVASLAPLAARAETDACTLATPAQVGAAIHVAVGAGTHVTPTFVKTCTWTPTVSSSIRAVTVNLQTAAFYDGAKQMAVRAAAALPAAKVQPAGVGDDGYYNVAGEMVTLLFKKGSSSAKVAVYAKMPADQIEAMELAIAKQVAAKL